VARIQLTVPEDLLQAIDAEAARRGLTRDSLLVELADQGLRRPGVERAAKVDQILLAATAHGGDVAELTKLHRPTLRGAHERAVTIDDAPPRPRLPLFHGGDETLAERVDDVLEQGFGRSVGLLGD